MAESGPCTVVIKELCSNISVADLTNVFSSFGQIVRIHLEKMTARAFAGHVTMASAREANDAKTSLDGTFVFGREVSVQVMDKSRYMNSLYFSFEAQQLGFTTDEATIDSLFSQFGDVTEVDIKRRTIDNVRTRARVMIETECFDEVSHCIFAVFFNICLYACSLRVCRRVTDTCVI
jgi:hypothetical protein